MRVVLTGAPASSAGRRPRPAGRGDESSRWSATRRQAAALQAVGRAGRGRPVATSGLTEALDGADAVIHAAGSYRDRHPKKSSAARCGTPTSGRRRGSSTPPRPPARSGSSTSRRSTPSATRTARSSTRTTAATSREGFLSWYDETKYGAHEVAEQRIAGGAPIVIVMPSQVYGPGDHSAFGEQLARRPTPASSRTAPLDDVGVGSSTSTTSRRGSSRRSTAARIGRSYVLPARRRRSPRRSIAAATIGGKPPGLRSRPASCAMAPLGSAHRPAEPARVDLGLGRRDVLGVAAQGGRRARASARPIEDGLPRHVRGRLTTLDPMARELPMFEPPGGAPHHGSGRARDDRDGRLRHAAPPPSRLDQGADAVGRELPRPQGPAPRPEPQHGLRGGPLPEHRGVLGPAHRDDHDPRRHLHPGLRLLRGQDRPADVVRRRRAAPGRRGGRARCGSSTSS